MGTDIDNVEVEINETIDKLIFGLNERRRHLLMNLRIKREKLRPNHEDDEIGKCLSRTRENLNALKFPNELHAMYRRMIIEVDCKMIDILTPAQEIKFDGNTRDLETLIATLGEITVHELPILPPVLQQAATPDFCSKPHMNYPALVRRNNSLHLSPKISLRQVSSKSHPREDTKQYLWGRMSRKDCETLLLQRAKQGEFIFRESISRDGELVLSMRYHDMIHHFNIKQERDWLCIGDNFRFKSLPEVILHFQKRPIANFREKDYSLVDLFISQPLEREEK